VNGGRALVDPNDFSDVPLEALVGEAHTLADAEVLFVMDLRRRPQAGSIGADQLLCQ